MTLGDRVLNIVEAWVGFSGFDTGESLAVLWVKSSHASSVPFKPQAVMDLSSRLQTEFRSGPDSRDLTRLNANSYAPGGSIDTVDDLVNAVMLAPPGAVAAEALAAMPAPAKAAVLAKKAAAKKTPAPRKKAAP